MLALSYWSVLFGTRPTNCDLAHNQLARCYLQGWSLVNGGTRRVYHWLWVRAVFKLRDRVTSSSNGLFPTGDPYTRRDHPLFNS